MASPHERLVAQLARIKELSGLSLRALATEAGLSSSSLSRYLTGRLVPPWDAVVALCRVVGRDPRPLRPIWAEATKVGAASEPRRNDLPADLIDFTGRESEYAQVGELLRSTGAAAIDGMAGVGKTSLAVHAAHRLAPEYPGGSLYLDLHGFTPGQQPLTPQSALARLLGALGITQLPAGVDERAALWRSELSRRRVLVVLDNAVDAEQVRPLLPGAGRSAVLITGRTRLVTLDGVPPVSVEPLDDGDAARLFGRASGRTIGEADAVSQVLRQCDGLPLALRMAGARLRHRPGWTVGVLAERLREHASRLDAVFGMSLQQLDAEQRRMFRLLGVLPGTDFDTAAATALAHLPPDRTEAALEELIDAHLVDERSPGRYRMHDLIRRYAADLAAAEEPQADAGLRRVLHHYREQALDPAAAVEWFDLEYDNLIAAFDAAVRLGVDEVVADLPQAMRVWFYRHRGTDDQVRLLDAGAAAAARLGRDQLHGALLADLGFAHAAAGRLIAALDAYQLALRTGVDDELEAGLALRIGFARRALGELDAAQTEFRRAGELFERIGRPAGQAQALAFDGWVSWHLGQSDEAIDRARASLALADGSARIPGLITLGGALTAQDPAEALRALQDALRLAEQHNLHHLQAWCHNELGVALRVMGRPEQALDHHREAAALLEPLAEIQLEIDVLHAYAETCRATGRFDQARGMLDRIVAIAGELDRPHDEARARAALQAIAVDEQGE